MLIDKVLEYGERFNDIEQLDYICRKWHTGLCLKHTDILNVDKYYLIEHTPRYNQRRTINLTKDQWQYILDNTIGLNEFRNANSGQGFMVAIHVKGL